MSSSDVVRCGRCGECCYVLPAGFLSEMQLFCTKFDNMEVDAEDGCTFGSDGEPFQSVQNYGVYLSTHPSNGYGSW